MRYSEILSLLKMLNREGESERERRVVLLTAFAMMGFKQQRAETKSDLFRAATVNSIAREENATIDRSISKSGGGDWIDTRNPRRHH